MFTVDVEERFDPDLQADVLDLRPADLLELVGLDRDEIDVLVVLASPPCTQFSLAASRYERFVDGERQTDDAREAVEQDGYGVRANITSISRSSDFNNRQSSM